MRRGGRQTNKQLFQPVVVVVAVVVVVVVVYTTILTLHCFGLYVCLSACLFFCILLDFFTAWVLPLLFQYLSILKAYMSHDCQRRESDIPWILNEWLPLYLWTQCPNVFCLELMFKLGGHFTYDAQFFFSSQEAHISFYSSPNGQETLWFWICIRTHNTDICYARGNEWTSQCIYYNNK